MKNIFAASILGLGLIIGASSGGLAESAKTSPVIVELFTSQGCYSCPPAEKYLGELSKNPNVVALEFHVDYWDDLVHGAAGKWKDVFSQPEFTARQRIYAGRLPKGQVYTPQMVVDGNSFAVGSSRRNVRRLIAKAQETRAVSQAGGSNHGSITISNGAQKGFVADIKGNSDRPLSVWLVRYLKNVETRVRSGENKGKKLTSHNIVTKVERLAVWQGEPRKIEFDPKDLKSTEGCAVLVQEESQGPIYAGGLCPTGMVNG